MNRTNSLAASRWALVLLATATLALAGCGRKGGLDLPPNNPTPPPAASTAPAVDADEQKAASSGNLFNPSYGADAPPTAARGGKKSFILDPLLNN